MANICTKSCLRYIILMGNLLLSLIGVLMLAGGIWLLSGQNSAQDIAYKIINTIDFDESVPSYAKESFEDIYSDNNLFYVIIGFGVLSIIISLFGFCSGKIGSGRLFCFVLFSLMFAVILFTLQIAVIASIHQQNTDKEDFQYKYKELWTVDLEKLGGSGYYKTVFFGVLTALSFGLLCFLLFTLILVTLVSCMYNPV